MSESEKVAGQGKLAKAEADKLSDPANKAVIYDRVDLILNEYGIMITIVGHEVLPLP